MDFRRFRLPVIWTSILLGSSVFLHLIGVYIYEGGSVVGVPGGSINIGLVGISPDIPNPMLTSQNKQHDLILSFLFRSTIRYNNETGIYEADLGTCDLADLSKVTCSLAGSGRWSDGTDIKIDDMIATFEAFRENPPNEKMKTYLAKLVIKNPTKGIIELSSPEKNSLILDLLSYPVLRSDMIERIRTGRLGAEGYVTSGPYAFLEKEKNTQYGYDRITIRRNTENAGIGWLDKYNFLFFPDGESLERAADIMSIMIPPEKYAKMLLGPRFDEYEYATYEYIGLFLNTDTINNALRKFIYLQSEMGLSGGVVPGERAIPELFPKSGTTSLKAGRSLPDILDELGYKKVEERQSLLEKETGILSGVSINYGTNLYFDTPTKKKILFSEVADGEITLGGIVPIGIRNVSINGYVLQEFRPGNKRFTYKVSLDNGTLIEGKNTYTLEFENNAGERNTRDTLTVYYSRDTAKLDEARRTVDDEFIALENTPELIATRLEKRDATKVKLAELNPRYYYNDRLEPYELNLMYLTEPGSLEKYSTQVADTLLDLGLKVNITPINSKEFSEMLQKGEKNYDMIIIGFEANGRFSRIGQIFLSTEAKNGINFAKIESKNLDSLFANLRVSYEKTKTEEALVKIGDYIESEAFFLPISSPLHSFYFDKSLKGLQRISTFQDITSLASVLQKVSIKEDFILELNEKSTGGFFRWLWNLMPL